MTVKKESIPTISKKVDEKKNVLPEVQDAVKQKIPLLDSKRGYFYDNFICRPIFWEKLGPDVGRDVTRN